MRRYRLLMYLLVELLTVNLFMGSSASGYVEHDKKSTQVDSASVAYTQAVKQLTDVMVNDVVGPCAATRYYTYAQLAAYECMYHLQNPAKYVSFAGRLTSYPTIKPATSSSHIDVELSCVYALLRVGESMLPSGYQLESVRQKLVEKARLQRHLSPELLTNSQAFAESIVKQIVQYAASDGYVKTSGYPRYTPESKPGFWQSTPPAYAEAYEAHWATLRTFLLDSAAQFRPVSPVAYSEQPNSAFYGLAKEVVDTVRLLTPEQRHIADFWDCNPFFLNQKGHMSFGTKKISPGGHWMGITSLVSLQQHLPLAETIRWHTLVALTMSDAMSSCWQEKYASNRVRPETYINQVVDRTWRPVLQTPPFPEYTSGHSVLSNAVAVVLSSLAGEAIPYTDTTEEEFGVPARSYHSFREAAQEAAISRLYGGIHFRDSIENGMRQGEMIGYYIVGKLNGTRRDASVHK